MHPETTVLYFSLWAMLHFHVTIKTQLDVKEGISKVSFFFLTHCTFQMLILANTALKTLNYIVFPLYLFTVIKLQLFPLESNSIFIPSKMHTF